MFVEDFSPDCSGCWVVLWHGCFISSYTGKMQKVIQFTKSKNSNKLYILMKQCVRYLVQASPHPKASTLRSAVFAAVPAGGLLVALACAAAAASAKHTCRSHL